VAVLPRLQVAVEVLVHLVEVLVQAAAVVEVAVVLLQALAAAVPVIQVEVLVQAAAVVEVAVVLLQVLAVEVVLVRRAINTGHFKFLPNRCFRTCLELTVMIPVDNWLEE
jgi:hypothetical protein